MSAQFFNFGNNETYLCFKWVSESGQVDPYALIADAYRKVAIDPEHLKSEDVCLVARDYLATDLLAMLEAKRYLFPLEEIYQEIGQVPTIPIATSRPTYDLLWRPLLAFAFSQIDCQKVAEALLIQARKWGPVKGETGT